VAAYRSFPLLTLSARSGRTRIHSKAVAYLPCMYAATLYSALIHLMLGQKLGGVVTDMSETLT
jgi:hypothetical protein